MGGKVKQLSYEHISTNIHIQDNKVCSECPYRIYANKAEVVNLGIGNIHSDYIFILPTYDIKAGIGYKTILSSLSLGYQEITGKDLFEQVYVTRVVKCNKSSNHDLYNSSVAPCSSYLLYELKRLSANRIVFFGSSYDDIVNNVEEGKFNLVGKTLYKMYNPSVLYYDNKGYKEKFFKDLSNILNTNLY